jgi:DamX protein
MPADDLPSPLDLPYVASAALRQRLDLVHHLIEFGRHVIVVQGVTGSGRSRLLTEIAVEAEASWHLIRLSLYEQTKFEVLFAELLRGCALGAYAAANDLRQRLNELATAGESTVVLIDDADWLDDDALARLLTLLREQVQDNALRVVLTSAIEADLVSRLEAAGASGTLVHVVDMPALSARELGELAAHALTRLELAAGEYDLDSVVANADGRPGRLLAALTGSAPSAAAELTRLGGRAMRPYVAAAAALAFVLVALACGVLLLVQREPAKVTTTHALPRPQISNPASAPTNASNFEAVDTLAAVAPPERQPSGMEASPPPAERPPADLATAAPTADFPTPAPPVPEPPAAVEPSEQTPPPAPAPRGAETPTPSAPPDYTAGWLQEQPAGAYVIQLFGSGDRSAAERFIRDNGLAQKAAVAALQRGGGRWYVVVSGLYPDRAQAVAALRALPSTLAQHKPWPRTIASLSP